MLQFATTRLVHDVKQKNDRNEDSDTVEPVGHRQPEMPLPAEERRCVAQNRLHIGRKYVGNVDFQIIDMLAGTV
jgi:hypothetical protein